MVSQRRYGRISSIGYRVTSVTSRLKRGGRAQAAGQRASKLAACDPAGHRTAMKHPTRIGHDRNRIKPTKDETPSRRRLSTRTCWTDQGHPWGHARQTHAETRKNVGDPHRSFFGSHSSLRRESFAETRSESRRRSTGYLTDDRCLPLVPLTILLSTSVALWLPCLPRHGLGPVTAVGSVTRGVGKNWRRNRGCGSRVSRSSTRRSDVRSSIKSKREEWIRRA